MQEIAIRASLEWSEPQIDLLKRTIAKGATDDEFALFAHICRRTGLDPFARQIFAIKRWNSQENRNTMSFQTGIDGYRLIADRTGQYAGSSDAEYEIGEEGYPSLAKVTVTKLVSGVPCQFTSSARWKEYCQVGRDGQPTSMWKKMPFLMLAKCAEALALRKAFPAELSGVYTHEEMSQADEEKSSYMSNKAVVRQKLGELAKEAYAVEPDGANGLSGDYLASQPATSDAAPPFNPETCPPAEEHTIEWYCAQFRRMTDTGAINDLYKSAPKEIKQDIYQAYTDAMKAARGRK